jgi:hypothetical protein
VDVGLRGNSQGIPVTKKIGKYPDLNQSELSYKR